MEFQWKEIVAREDWDSFVFSSKEASVYHTWRWREVIELNGYKPLYLGCRHKSNGELVAVWPFFYVKSIGPFYVLDSMPLSDIGGPLISTDFAELDALFTGITESIPLTRKLVFSLRSKINNWNVKETFAGLGYTYTSGSGHFKVDLSADNLSRMWENVFKKHQRNQIRHFEKEGAQINLKKCGDDFQTFYGLYRLTMERRDYILHSEQFMKNIISSLGDSFKVLFVYSNDKPICAVSFLADDSLGVVHLTYVGYDAERRSISPYFFAVWNWLNWASKNGYHVANLGNGSSNPESPNFRFKKQFGGTFYTHYTFTIPLNRILYNAGRSVKNLISH